MIQGRSRRWPYGLILAACGLPLGIGAIVLTSLPSSAGLLAAVWHNAGLAVVGSAQALARAASDPMAMLAGRSPGARDSSGLASIKAARHAAPGQRARSAPHERVLSEVRDRLPVITLPETMAGILDAPSVFPESAGAGPELAALTGPQGLAGSPAFGGIVPSVAGGPEVAPPDGGGPTPSAAVPEPSTWLTMLLGTALVATILRRRPAGAVPA